MTALVLFLSTFVLVFALGLQSLNVNGRHYVWAFFTSFAIGGSNMVLLKLGPDANWLEVAAFLSGGPLGIVTSMWVHPLLVSRSAASKRRRAGDEHCNVERCGQLRSDEVR